MKAHFDSVQPSSVAGLSIVFGRLSFSLARLFDRFYLCRSVVPADTTFRGWTIASCEISASVGPMRCAKRASLSGGTDPDTPGRR